MALNKAKVLSITSVKGGVGKTTTTLNIAGILSKMGKKTLIIDLDFYGSSIAASLNLLHNTDIYSMSLDISNNKMKNFNDYTVSYNEYIDVLASPKDPRNAKKIYFNTLNVILYKAILKYDIILIDTNHMLNDINLFALDLSDLILYVINNDSMNLKNMKTYISILNDMDAKNYRILLNKSICKGKNYYSNYDVENILGKKVDYIISENFYIKNIDKYIMDGKILSLDKKISKYKDIKVYEKIIEEFIKGRV